jgi:YegS/Rv2252/BmrU family lipid kinase
MTAFVVVNPRSGNGRTGREWRAIERQLAHAFPHMSVAFTQKRGQASALVRHALAEGHHEIIAVGGDGTVNEAVNGFFDARGPVSPDAVFGFVMSGTGGDFRKTFGIGEGAAQGIERLKRASVKPIDIGRVSCLSDRGEPVVRYFANIASFGLSGRIVQSVNRARIAKLFGGSFAFAFHSAAGMLTHRNRTVRIMLDTGFDAEMTISTVAIANGQYFGGGMRVAPNATPDDGAFDVVVIAPSKVSQALGDMKQIYTGAHVSNPAVRILRAKKIVAAPTAENQGRAVHIEADGESAGKLPATFEILPRALNLRC